MTYFIPSTPETSAVSSVINFVIDSANSYREQYNELASDAEKDARILQIAVSELRRDGELNDVTFKGINDNNFGSISDLRNEFDAKYHYLFNILNNTVPDTFNNFLSEIYAQNFEDMEKFLIDGIKSGGIGLPPEVVNQIWGRDRERLDLDADNKVMTNRRSMAARGFMVDDGAEKWTEAMIRLQASKEISNSSRERAIDEENKKIEWVKFAVAEVRNFRSMALDATFKYISSILSIHDPAFKYASGYVDSYKTFYDSVNAYYNSVNSVNRLELEKANMIDRRNFDYDKISSDFIMKHKSDRVSTLTELARSMGSQAGAALSGINSLVTLGANAQTLTNIN